MIIETIRRSLKNDRVANAGAKNRPPKGEARPLVASFRVVLHTHAVPLHADQGTQWVTLRSLHFFPSRNPFPITLGGALQCGRLFNIEQLIA